MKNISTEKTHEAAFSGGSVSDAPKAASCADMAPPLSNRGGAETEADLSTEHETFEKYTTFLTDSKGRLIEVPLRRGKPESKPLYDSIRQVKTFEYIAGCVEGGNSGCTCYSEQGTPLKEVTKAMCKEYVRNGLPFNPYKDKNQTTQLTQPQNQAKSNDNSQVLALGGKSPQNLMYDGYVEAGEQFQQRGGTVGSN